MSNLLPTDRLLEINASILAPLSYKLSQFNKVHDCLQLTPKYFGHILDDDDDDQTISPEWGPLGCKQIMGGQYDGKVSLWI